MNERASSFYEWQDNKWYGVPIAYTDGACTPHTGEDAQASFGVFWGVKHPYNSCDILKGILQTNQRAELVAVFDAIKTAVRVGMRRLIIRTCSQYACDTLQPDKIEKLIRTDYMRNNEPVPNHRLLKRIVQNLDHLDLKVEYVKAHTDYNNRAEFLAHAARRDRKRLRPNFNFNFQDDLFFEILQRKK